MRLSRDQESTVFSAKFNRFELWFRLPDTQGRFRRNRGSQSQSREHFCRKLLPVETKYYPFEKASDFRWQDKTAGVLCNDPDAIATSSVGAGSVDMKIASSTFAERATVA